ncbi:MAG: formylglycine-generating enzyme family protein [Gammaproteobacteria bacterium]|nr:formylglycine-generating enzyme family protein [Gammaproteobacteria bacterium]
MFQDPLACGGLGPVMVRVPAGYFMMGDMQGHGSVDEKPVHEVKIAKPFAIGVVEVTVKEFSAFISNTGFVTEAEREGGCYMRGGKSWKYPASDFSQMQDHPVVCVSWNDANEYAQWLTEQTGKQYRLPTEAEWEYAARAGEEDNYAWGNDVGIANARCDRCGQDSKLTGTYPVSSFKPNDFGLYDMSGNAWEWTASEYTSPYNGQELTVSTKGKKQGKRAIRSGGWLNWPEDLRASNRGEIAPTDRYSTLGFRIVRVVE